MRPTVVEYRSDWPARAAALIDDLRRALGPTAARIDHIGSTAIPGMAAKDVLDLQVSVVDLAAAEGAFDAPLTARSFERSPFQADHVPAGRNDAPTSWVKRLWLRRSHAEGDVNLHVRAVGSPNERLALLFRDWFRAHPEAIPAYAGFKRRLAQVVQDTATYADVKDPVVDMVVVMAETWAASVAWTP